MAANDSRVEVGVDVLLRHLEQVPRLRRELEALARIKVGANVTRNADRAALAAQKLAVQTRELENRQERARQTAERLELSQRKLDQAHERAATGARKTATAHADLDKTLGKVGGSLRNLGLGLTSLGSALSIGLTAPLAAIGVVSTQSAVSMDSLKRGLVAVTGSSAEAEVQLKRLTEIAKLPGIGFQEAIQGSIRLQALGVNAEVAERALRAFSNAVALTGGGRNELDRALVQLTQLISKGRVLQQDLRFIIENAPATGKALRDAFGTVDPQQIETLGLTTDQFLDRLLSGLEGLPKAAAGARNTFDNFADSVFRASSKIGEAIIPVLTSLIESFEPAITSLADAFKSLPPAVQTTVVIFGGLAAALGPALFLLGQFATGIGGVISGVGRVIALRATLIAQSAAAAAAQQAEAVAAVRLAGAQATQAAIAAELAAASAAAAAGVARLTLANGAAVPVAARITALHQAQAVAAAELAAAEQAAAAATATAAAAGTKSAAAVAAGAAAVVSLAAAILAAAAAAATFGFALARYTKAGTSAETTTAKWSRSLLIILNPLAALAFRVGEATAEEEEFKKVTDSTASAVNNLTTAIDRVAGAFRGMKDAADRAADADDNLVAGARGFLTTFARNTREAEKGLEELKQQFPQLADAIGRARKRREIGEFFDQLTGKRTPRGEKEIRAAAEALANAVAAELEAGQKRQLESQRDANEESLAVNEFNFRQQLKGFREFLAERVRLQKANLELEIKAQEAARDRAEAAEKASQARAALPGTTPGEREKESADQQAAVTRRKDAEAEIERLRARQRALDGEAAREIRASDKDRAERARELTRQFQELRGEQQKAADSAVDERFREELAGLTADLQAALLAEDRAAAERLGNQIRLIQAVKDEEKARNAVNEALRQAGLAEGVFANRQEETRQSVELRGLSEREALRRRLADEEALKVILTKQRDVLRDTAEKLKVVPAELNNQIDELTLRIEALGKVPLSEQFALAEREFARTQDELRDKVADVERAVRSRDIAEAEGRLLIRRLNGQYAGDLERQLVLLKQIAARSNDANLRRQADAAGQTAKDVRAAADEVANLDRQLRAVSVDAFNDSLSQLFRDLRDNTESAAQDILNFLNRILDRVNEFIGENLAREITESLFPDPNAQGREGGIGGFFKRVLGIGGGPSTDANTTATQENTAAINNLTTTFGGQPAGGGDVVGGAVGSFIGSLFGGGGEGEEGGGFLNALGGLFGVGGATEGLTGQGATVIDALNINSQELAKNTQALRENSQAQRSGGEAGFLNTLFGGEEAAFASGGRVPIRVSPGERFYPPAEVRRIGLARLEAANARLRLGDRPGIIEGPGTRTSDSIHAFAPPGSFIMNAEATEAALLSTVNSGRGRFALGGVVDSLPADSFGRGGGGSIDLKQVLVDKRSRFREEMQSAEGRKIVADIIGEEAGTIRRRLGLT